MLIHLFEKYIAVFNEPLNPSALKTVVNILNVHNSEKDNIINNK